MFFDRFIKNPVDRLIVLLNDLWYSKSHDTDRKLHELKSYIIREFPTKADLFNSYDKKGEFGVIGLLFNGVATYPQRIAPELAEILNDILSANVITLSEIENNNACKIYHSIYDIYADPIVTISNTAVENKDMLYSCKKLMITLINNTSTADNYKVKAYLDLYDILIYSISMHNRQSTVSNYRDWFMRIHSMLQKKIGYCYNLTRPNGNIIHSIAKSGNYDALDMLVIANPERERIVNDTNVANSVGKTPLYLAYENKHFAIAKCLEALGYTIIEKDKASC